MLRSRDIEEIRSVHDIPLGILVFVGVYGNKTLPYSHGDPFGLTTDRIIPGCPITRYDGCTSYHTQGFRTIHELVRALHTIPGEFRVIHVNMVNGDWDSNEMCGIPISSDEEKTPRTRDEYIEYITRRRLYTPPTATA